jgi:hypothetical protein
MNDVRFISFLLLFLAASNPIESEAVRSTFYCFAL